MENTLVESTVVEQTVVEAPIETKAPEQRDFNNFDQNFERFFGSQEKKAEPTTEQNTVVETKVETVEVPQPDYKWLEEKSGGKLKGWEDVEVLLNKQPERVVPEFANDVSKSIYEALINGKEDEIENYFLKRNVAKSLQSKPADAIVKAHIREQFPTFTEVETDWFFNKNYSFDESQYEDDEIGLSVAKKERDAKLQKASQDALNYFASQAQEVQLPKFEPAPMPEVQGVDLNSEAAKNVAAFVESQSVGYAKGNEIQYKYSNKENGANIEGKLTLDDKSISEYEEKIGYAADVVFAKRYLNKDGEFDTKQFARDQYILNNLPKLLQAAGGDMYNKGYVAKIMQDRNIPIQNAPVSGEAPTVTDARERAEELKRRNFPLDAILKLTGVDLEK
jgi:hypothetical protein